MATIADYLAQIQDAVYGNQVRSAIHDAIQTCYSDVSASSTLADTAAANANTKATLADTKATLANTAATNANTKATLADTKATLANTAAANADTKA
ncbi:MAG TPA: hypothetical protein PKN45_09470, partial [Candidatus Limiplasma sp.]|nr:hypothetical protein [Candidatus Limiplasma sp.]